MPSCRAGGSPGTRASTTCPTTTSSTSRASSARADRRAVPHRRAAHRHADLRGQLVSGRGRGDGGERGGDPGGAERLAVPARQVRRAHAPHGGAGGGDRAAARLRQHGGWAGRPGLRRRLVRAQPRRAAGGAAAGFRRDDPSRGLRGDGRRAGARRPGRSRCIPGRSSRPTGPWRVGLGDYMRKTGFAKVLLGLSGGRRQRARRGDRGRRARGGERALRDAAVGVHLGGEPRGRRGGGGAPRLPARRALDRAGAGGGDGDAGAAHARGGPPI